MFKDGKILIIVILKLWFRDLDVLQISNRLTFKTLKKLKIISKPKIQLNMLKTQKYLKIKI